MGAARRAGQQARREGAQRLLACLKRAAGGGGGRLRRHFWAWRRTVAAAVAVEVAAVATATAEEVLTVRRRSEGVFSALTVAAGAARAAVSMGTEPTAVAQGAWQPAALCAGESSNAPTRTRRLRLRVAHRTRSGGRFSRRREWHLDDEGKYGRSKSLTNHVLAAAAATVGRDGFIRAILPLRYPTQDNGASPSLRLDRLSAVLRCRPSRGLGRRSPRRLWA